MRLIDADEVMEHVWRDKLDSRELIAEMIENAPTVKIEINFADVQRYCKPRNLLVITRELLDELTHTRNQCCNEKEQNIICKYHRVFNTSKCGNFELCYAEKGSPEVHCGGNISKCEMSNDDYMMPKEEAIKILEDWDGYFVGHGSDDVNAALNMAINSLKQESVLEVLDKIRSDIENAAFDSQGIDCEHNSIMILDLDDALNIIDKYRMESEE